VPEPVALEVVVGDLADQDRLDRDPVLLLLAPAARPAEDHPAGEALLGVQRLQLRLQLLPGFHRERAGRPDVAEHTPVVQAEQERADPHAGLVDPVSPHDDVDGPLVLHLDHGPLAGLVGDVLVLGDDAVES
jgi:hypothetical protein